MKILVENNYFRTADLPLAAIISMSFPLEAVDRNPKSRKAFFIFRRSKNLDELIEGFWRGELKVEPQAYFNALRLIKTRLYDNSIHVE